MASAAAEVRLQTRRSQSRELDPVLPSFSPELLPPRLLNPKLMDHRATPSETRE